jgi:hypothetical protein
LDDAEWWNAWLPRLYELLGRDARSGETRPVDDRGYVDLTAYLFPPIDGVTWRSLMWPVAATADAARNRTEKRSQAATVSEPGDGRARVWEPVIRHVAVALAALEATARPGTDAYRALQAQTEITGPWVSVLRRVPGSQDNRPADKTGGSR